MDGKKVSRVERCCPSHYRVVYDKRLAEQVSCHLKDELTKIAEQRAKTICQPHIQAIQDRS